MTPSLPKTMILNDKTKSKAVRTVDGTVSVGKLNQSSGSLQLNPLNRSANTSRNDTVKHYPGKLLVLKASKDGVTVSNTAFKSEGGNPTLVSTHRSIGGAASIFSATCLSSNGQNKRFLDRRVASQPSNGVLDAMAGSHTKDSMEDKRPSIMQAQNRSDFFNTLRKKAASNGSTSNTLKSDSLQLESVVVALSEGSVLEEACISNCKIESETSTFSQAANCMSQIHRNVSTEFSQRQVSIFEEEVGIENNTSVIECTEERLSADSEEEEAAFMRSLGWEENAEGSELTEEEINAFYKMREKRNNQIQLEVRVEPSLCHLGILSSGISSSESDSDD